MRGGLFIPDTAKEKPQQGEIIAVGPGRYEKNVRVPMEVKVGDKVLYGKYSGTEVTIDAETVSDPPRVRCARGRRTKPDTQRAIIWQPRNYTLIPMRARLSSAASTSSQRRSRSHSAPRAGTSSSTRSSVHRPSPRTA